MMANRTEFNDNDFQEHYRITYATSGHTYMHVRPAYRFGFNAAASAQKGATWNEQTDRSLRYAWDSRGAAMRYDDARHAIREGWNRAQGKGKPRALGSSTYDLTFRDIEG